GIDDLRERIIRGTRERLRPVLLTASAAALGFLPMAISTSAGAEVQRPLATVVVGGLITATLLTMIVLPVMYCLFETKSKKKKKQRLPSIAKLSVLLLLLLSGSAPVFAQELSRNQAIEAALRNNPLLQATEKDMQQASNQLKTAFDPDKTLIYYNFDQNNIAENGQPLKVWGINQQLNFPAIYTARKKLFEQYFHNASLAYQSMKLKLTKEVEIAWAEMAYQSALKRNYTDLLNRLSQFAEASRKSFESGASNQLDYLAAATKEQSVAIKLQETEKAVRAAAHHLQTLMHSQQAIETFTSEYLPMTDDTLKMGDSLSRMLTSSIGETAIRQHKVERYQAYPDLNLEYFVGTNAAEGAKRYNGFQVGLAIPVWFPSKIASVKAARLHAESATLLAESMERKRKDAIYSKKLSLQSAEEMLNFYQKTGNTLNDALRKAAIRSFETGEINALQYLLLLDQVISAENEHLNAVHRHNTQLIELKYFIHEEI
ncbi:MAG: efflux RND transporter permease subunit, partial [Bacteroidales bacterium]|nr:efflux RND transporter permease subunit [Bacteroidales bacterium]